MRGWLYAGAALAFVAIFAAAAVYRGNAIAASAEASRLEKELAVSVAVNKSNVELIDKITAARARDDALLSELSKQVDEITKAADVLAAARNEAGRDNETVRNYLDAPIPDELRRLYVNP